MMLRSGKTSANGFMDDRFKNDLPRGVYCEIEGIALALAYILPSIGPISLAAGAGLGIATGTYAIATGLAYLAVAAGLTIGTSFVKSLLAPKSGNAPSNSAIRPADSQIVLRQALPTRKRSYGLVCRGGDTGFEETKDGDLYWEILHQQGQSDGVVSHFLGDTEVQIDDDGQVIVGAPWAGKGKIQIFNMMGKADQECFEELANEFPDAVGEDGEDHRWRGVTKTLVVYRGVAAEDVSTFYGSGVPPYRMVFRSSLLFDPRDEDQVADGDPDRPMDNGWLYDTNAGMAMLDYLRHPDGFKRRQPTQGARRMVPISRFYLPEWIDFINLSDEDVPLKGAGTVKRYQLCGSYDLTADPKDVLSGMQQACDAEIYIRGDGKIGIQGGRWTEPEITLGQKNDLSHSMKPGNRKISAFNRFNAKYASPEHDFQMVDAAIWRDTDNIALRGEEIIKSVEFPWCPSHSQARRIGKILMHVGNPAWQGVVRTGPAGLRKAARERRIVNFEMPEYFDARPFLRTSYKPAPNLAAVEWNIISIDPSAYAWNAEAEEGDAPPVPVDTAQDNTVPLPTGFSVVAGQVTLQGGVSGAVLTATWAAPAAGTFGHEINWRRVGAVDWISQRFAAGTTSFISQVVEDGAEFEVRLRALTPALRPSEWTATVLVTATADATPPGQPSAFASSKAGSNTTLTWTNPNSPNLFKVILYRGTANNFALASPIATLFGGIAAAKSYADNGLANGTYWWWVQAFNASGVSSTQVGPQTQTIP